MTGELKELSDGRATVKDGKVPAPYSLPPVEVDLQLLDARIDLAPACHAIEFIERTFMKAFNDAVGLWASSRRPRGHRPVQFDRVVCNGDESRIVLDHGVAEIAQTAQNIERPAGIARMRSSRRFNRSSRE